MTGRKLGAWIATLLSFAALALSVVFSGWMLAFPISILLVLCIFNWKTASKIVLRARVWGLILAPVVVCSLLTGPRDLGIFCREGIGTGAAMATRALCIVLSIALITGRLSISHILRFFESRRMKGFGLALGVAYNMLFDLSRTGRVVFETLRLRGVVRKNPLRALWLFIISVIYNALGHADDIVHAAAVRGFDTFNGDTINGDRMVR
jgi:energy-coupling factor transporter transmembrane protein EcfT